MTAMTLRPARLYDAAELHALQQPYVAQGLLLPRSPRYLCENIRDYIVAVAADGRLAAGGALHFLDDDVAEIQSLAVTARYRGAGLGGRLLQALLVEAREHQAWKAFALTHAPEFFVRFGFARTELEALPQKLTRDCLGCPKRLNCHQVAVIADVFAVPLPAGARPRLEAAV
ncbi:MAG: GNAT family N-acetyltransferase [Terriglobales bacterium]